jgi:HEAT repeats
MTDLSPIPPVGPPVSPPAIEASAAELSNEALVAQLGAARTNDRAIALALLVRRGPPAARALRLAIDNPDADTRERALRGLAEIGDPASADIFVRFLRAPEPRVRALAAHGLVRCGDPRGPEASVRAIDDAPDELHYPVTLAVYDLTTLGPKALPLVAPLLSAPAAETRQRAFMVIRRVIDAHPELGTWEALEHRFGAYDPDGTAAGRDATAGRWQGWIVEVAHERSGPMSPYAAPSEKRL